MGVNNIHNSLPPNNAQNHNEPSLFSKIVNYLFEILENLGSAAKSLFVAEPLNIKSYPDGYKPKIVITGEKADYAAIEALQRYANHQVEYVNLGDLEQKSKELDVNKDLLIIGVQRYPGSNPLRLFSFVDGPLFKYKDAIMKFNNRGALIFLHPSETTSEEAIKNQIHKQLKEMKGELVYPSYGRRVALAVQKLFSS